MKTNIIILLILFALSTASLTANGNPSDCDEPYPVDEQNKRYITAVQSVKPPTIDGVLDDVAWELAEFQYCFIQREPEEGAPATEKTGVGILYDSGHLYIGVKCYDSEPDMIIAKEMRRDADLQDDDHIALVLDTYHDRRSAYYFVTNPHGSKRDAVFANEGRNYNPAWDGIWTSRAQITEEGWFAEVAIPWKTLRFAEGDSCVWGFNIQRVIRRKNEQAFWQLVPRDFGHFGLFRLSEAGTLDGLRSLKMGGNLEIKPYFLGGLERDEITEFQTDALADVGLDVKVAVTANMALDLTLNTDFAQVEADREQVNLTRFSLYFPEKREFFLEGAEIFAFGRQARRRAPDMSLFYSRRIGLVDGTEARIIGGAKLIGKVGQYHIGAMNMQTVESTITDDDSTYNVPATNFTVLRFRRDVLQRGSIGMMFLNKEEIDSSHFNRTLGFDGYLPIGKYVTVLATIAGTFEPSDGDAYRLSDNLAGQLQFDFSNDLWQVGLDYLDIGGDFNPEVGFVRRTDFRDISSRIEYRPRPKNSRVIRQFEYAVDAGYRLDYDGTMLDNRIGAMYMIRFQNGGRFSLNLDRTEEFIDEDWEVREGFTIPVATYTNYKGSLRASSDESRPFSGRFSLSLGDYYTGRSMRFGLGSSITKISRFRMELDYSHAYVDLPEGNFQTNTLGLRTFYFFSTELYFKAYLQWNDDKLEFDGKEKVLGNLLLRWIYRPGSDLYIVYNDVRMVGAGGEEIKNRTLMLKATFFWRK